MSGKTYPQKTIKDIKKGDKFSVVSFTGMNLGQYEVTAVSKSQFKAVRGSGAELIFNRADGVQANANDVKYANKAVDLMPAPERKGSTPPAPPAPPAAPKGGKGKKDETPPAAPEAPAAGKGKGKKDDKKTSTKDVPPEADIDGEESGDEDWEEA